jgi:hypothetical protein
MEPVNTAELVAAGSTVPRDRRGLGGLAVLLLIAAYIGTLAFEYYFRVGGVRRHHLESAWMWMVAACVVFTLTSRRSVEARERPTERWRPPASTTLVVAVVLALAVYYPALGLGFLSDDFTLADLAARNQFFGQSWTFLRPLPLLGYKAAGAHPATLHLFNVVLHGVNAALVSRLAMVFGLAPVQASAAGLLFLLFPAHLEAVAWCAGIQDVLMTTGVLGSILAATVSGAALSMAALIASLFSKETAVAAPVLMVLSNRQRWRVALGALAVAGAYAVWRIATRPLTEGYAAAPSPYMLKELLVRPFATLTVPFQAARLGAWPWLGTLLVGGLALLIVRAAWAWRGNRRRIWMASALALWVFVGVAPVYSMFDVSGTLEGSRYVYLPAAGWSMLIAALLMPARSRRGLGLVAAVCVIGLAGVRMNFVPWTSAARMRDEVLAAAARAKAAGCTAIWIPNVPDAVHGAYVFRNGLAEAVAPVALSSSAPPECWISVPFSADPIDVSLLVGGDQFERKPLHVGAQFPRHAGAIQDEVAATGPLDVG